MNCKNCGKEIDANGKELCAECETQIKKQSEDIANSLSDFGGSENIKEKKENKTLLIVIITGFFCPLIWIIYFLTKNRDTVKKVASEVKEGYMMGVNMRPSSVPSQTPQPTLTGNTSSAFEEEVNEKEFGFIGGDGNIYRSGGMFCDWSGSYVEWGSSFRDKRGNLVAWGQPFYDNRDNYITWGSPFYDAGDNYVCPRG